ncbi:hypothetical protein CG747_16225 [Streptomyces sp. CB02959]|uniref:hypothetical protein n=1 Tax=Streptomyces sp. CB02959 TaxID=2020330 RepID=UPI000C276BA6|nr:hypothetical protein [Streptomyces sp. CB02959]PJN39507.1 hypothetical protein CG747_16225 [Streptomyces sp. CB02959]
MGGLTISVAEWEVSRETPQLVYGQIWFTLAGVDFPGAHWTDSPTSVLGSMSEALDDAASGEVGEVYFFDGPYYVTLTPHPAGGRDEVEVLAICDRAQQLSGTGGGTVEARGKVPLNELRQHYVDVVAERERWARQHGHSEVADVLSRMASRVRP